MWWTKFPDSLQALVSDGNLYGVSIACLDQSKFHFMNYGVSNYPTHSSSPPITKHTKFQVASLGKFLTSYLCLELEHLGLLDLDCNRAPLIAKLYDFSFPLNGINISVRQLLAHRSGFCGPPGVVGVQSHKLILPELLEFYQQPLSFFDPLSIDTYHYSFLSYVILQRLLETLFDSSFHTLLSRHLLLPLGIVDFYSPSVIDSDQYLLTNGYDPSVFSTHFNFFYYPSADAAAGLWFSPFEFSLILRSLFPGFTTQLSGHCTLRDFLYQSQFLSVNYHLGIQHSSLDGLSIYEHAGINPGFFSYLLALDQYQKAFILFSNDIRTRSIICRLRHQILTLMQLP